MCLRGDNPYVFSLAIAIRLSLSLFSPLLSLPLFQLHIHTRSLLSLTLLTRSEKKMWINYSGFVFVMQIELDPIKPRQCQSSLVHCVCVCLCVCLCLCVCVYVWSASLLFQRTCEDSVSHMRCISIAPSFVCPHNDLWKRGSLHFKLKSVCQFLAAQAVLTFPYRYPNARLPRLSSTCGHSGCFLHGAFVLTVDQSECLLQIKMIQKMSLLLCLWRGEIKMFKMLLFP